MACGRYDGNTVTHTLFDMAAALSSLVMTILVHRWRLTEATLKIEHAGAGYVLVLLAGAAAGGFGLGTLNLRLSGDPGVARSVVGALAGAIVAIELFKWRSDIKGSTGLIFVPAFATTVAVGRWGCFLAGTEDGTYGTPTTLPWAHDFGDGVLRHPVQLYESFAMLAFLFIALILLARRNDFFLRNGFYVMVLYYAGQRFFWEFMKPYGTLLGPLNLFHLVCAGLALYACVMMRTPHERQPA
jgi:phosphatidylglycerol---prolipoprotein diacylglyceryl transferase